MLNKLHHYRRRLLALGIIVLGGYLAFPHAYCYYLVRSAQGDTANYHPERAATKLERAKKLVPNNAQNAFLLARAYRQQGELVKARDALWDAQRLHYANSDQLAYEWALLNATGGNIGEVEDFLQAKIESDPREVPLVCEAMIEGYNTTFRTLDAMMVADFWLKVDPDNLRALELRGVTFILGNGAKRGSDELRQVIARDPTRHATRKRLANALLDLGVYGEALEHYHYLNEQKTDPEMLAKKARCLAMLGDKAAARQAVDQATSEFPEHAFAWRTKGQIYYGEEKYTAAESYFLKAIELNPNDHQTYYFTAICQQQMGKAAEAKTNLAKSQAIKDVADRFNELSSRKLAERPLDPTLHYEMGTLLSRVDQLENAERWMLSALGLDQSYRPALIWLVDYYTKQNNPAKADEYRQRLVP